MVFLTVFHVPIFFSKIFQKVELDRLEDIKSHYFLLWCIEWPSMLSASQNALGSYYRIILAQWGIIIRMMYGLQTIVSLKFVSYFHLTGLNNVVTRYKTEHMLTCETSGVVVGLKF